MSINVNLWQLHNEIIIIISCYNRLCLIKLMEYNNTYTLLFVYIVFFKVYVYIVCTCNIRTFVF